MQERIQLMLAVRFFSVVSDERQMSIHSAKSMVVVALGMFWRENQEGSGKSKF
jgi:hypothetical protein